MVVGLGIDVASIARIEQIFRRHGQRFLERILTAREREDLGTSVRVESLAGRFAAKEATAKALGGPNDVWWHDVEVRRTARGAPQLVLLGNAATHAQRLGIQRTLLSITHDAGVAAAVVVLESSP